MTESFRRSGEYPQGDQQQSAYSGQPYEQSHEQPYASSTHPTTSYPAASHPASSTASSVNPEWPAPPAHQPPPPAHQLAPAADAGARGGAPTALLTEPVPASPAVPRKRAKGPLALLAAVAIAAAAVGGGTAYAFQELTGSDTAAGSATSTSVVATSKKGTVAGVAEAVSPSIVEISATSNAGSSTGSGVVITTGGEIITNNHVISGASQIKVQLSNGKSYTASVVGTDSKKDLALIKLENAPSGLTPATLGNSDAVKVGDEVVAIGSPEGLTGTVTSGIVSALDRDVTVSTDESQGQQQQQPGGGGGSGQWPFEFGGQEFNGDTGSSKTTYKALQTDASLNPGNSGGALIDMNGNIIGINSAMYSAATDSSSSSSAGSVGLGFAIPVNTVKADLASLRSGGSDS
ncbi:S1C family serine protease [Streptomyces sp. DSM 40484]|uniref:S1C family serine protease n=1 Tax=Streptomyces kroppenstedtii TaxID=3051181 RepID=UPI0028D67A8D|nr:trypsin-like peptidase domain-containing protein [Streptomyces sp. DSM 40484]